MLGSAENPLSMTVQTNKAESEFLEGVTGFILLGGKSSRYGSNKAFVEIEGVRLLDRVARVMKSIFHRIVLLTNIPPPCLINAIWRSLSVVVPSSRVMNW